MSSGEDFAPSKLRDYYDLLHDLSEGEQTALAEFHSVKTFLIANRVAKSVGLALRSPKIQNLIYGELDEAGNVVDDRGALPQVNDPSKIVDTDHFASFIRDQEWPIEGSDGSSFEYVDRELSPLRITEEGGARPKVRWMDLLLRSETGRPIATELKVGRDSLPYYALIQALMYAADLCGQSQFERLNQLLPENESRFEWRNDDPSIDVAVIFFNPPDGSEWTYWNDNLAATKKLAKALQADPKVNGTIGKISLIRGATLDGQVLFREIS